MSGVALHGPYGREYNQSQMGALSCWIDNASWGKKKRVGLRSGLSFLYARVRTTYELSMFTCGLAVMLILVGLAARIEAENRERNS